MKRILLISLLLVTAAITFNSCILDSNRIKGRGDLVTKNVTVDYFNSINLNSVIHVEIEQSYDHTVKIEAQENLMDYIEIYEEDKVLYIDAKEPYNLEPSKKITVYLTTPEIRSIESNGTGDTYGSSIYDDIYDLSFIINGTGNIDFAWTDAQNVNVELDGTGDMYLIGNGNNFDADIDGTGNLDFEGDYTTTFTTIDGTGSCFANGSSTNNTVQLDGTGSFYGKDFHTEYSNIKINGTGDAEVYCTQNLIIDLDGSGDVYYYGNPEQLQVDNDGSGDIFGSN